MLSDHQCHVRELRRNLKRLPWSTKKQSENEQENMPFDFRTSIIYEALLTFYGFKEARRSENRTRRCPCTPQHASPVCVATTFIYYHFSVSKNIEEKSTRGALDFLDCGAAGSKGQTRREQALRANRPAPGRHDRMVAQKLLSGQRPLQPRPRTRLHWRNVEQSKVLIKEGGVQLLVTIVDTPGFGDAVDNSNCWQPVIDYIDSKFEDYLNAESRVNRRQMPDNRVQCCLYFIAPIGHGLKPLDTEFIKHLHEKVNIIPLIAKADTLTPEECQQFTKQIMKEIQEHRIKIYEFPETDDEENYLVKKIKLQQHHEQMKKNLEAQHKELEKKRPQFEDEKANWEAQQHILEQQNSLRTLEKNKKKGKIF
ncbi:septin-7-like [Symphalangus syndactylus]|uniref:septin-7-like n=1 Tax=Symphalangus syndactylus TaxID=9590 RepID=UPI00300498E5